MTDEELKVIMDKCGQKMFEYDQKELKFQKETKDLTDEISKMKETIKAEILKRGVGMDSWKLKVSFRKGAVRWDSEKLEDYGIDHPEIMAFRKKGEPTVGFSVRAEGCVDD